ncbi:MAG: hypothetical protein KF720_20595 [Rubrivivax sp.]|nr:hypothetical protein [Rubrivivax sp.]
MTFRSIVFIGAALVTIGSSAWLLLDSLSPPTAGPSAGSDTAPLLARQDETPARIPEADSSLPPAAPAQASDDRFRLVGVVAVGSVDAKSSSNPGNGFALISVDGKPARAFHVGATVDGDTVLTALTPLGATLASPRGGEAISLQVASATPTYATMPAPAPPPGTGSPAGVDMSMRPPAEQKNLGTKHPPLPTQPVPATQVPEESATQADGRWTR